MVMRHGKKPLELRASTHSIVKGMAAATRVHRDVSRRTPQLTGGVLQPPPFTAGIRRPAILRGNDLSVEAALQFGLVKVELASRATQSEHFCSGVLLAPNIVLTAGHCAPFFSDPTTMFTMANGESRMISMTRPTVSFPANEIENHQIRACFIDEPFTAPNIQYHYNQIGIPLGVPLDQLESGNPFILACGLSPDAFADPRRPAPDSVSRWRSALFGLDRTNTDMYGGQFLIFSPSPDAASLAPGDSGGPVFLLTFPFGPMALIGINNTAGVCVERACYCIQDGVEVLCGGGAIAIAPFAEELNRLALDSLGYARLRPGALGDPEPLPSTGGTPLPPRTLPGR